MEENNALFGEGRFPYSKKQIQVAPAFEEEVRISLDKIWENRDKLSYNNLDNLKRLGNKK